MIVILFTGDTIAMRNDPGGSGSRRAQQARIDLMLALGAGMNTNQITEMFDS